MIFLYSLEAENMLGRLFLQKSLLMIFLLPGPKKNTYCVEDMRIWVSLWQDFNYILISFQLFNSIFLLWLIFHFIVCFYCLPSTDKGTSQSQGFHRKMLFNVTSHFHFDRHLLNLFLVRQNQTEHFDSGQTQLRFLFHHHLIFCLLFFPSYSGLPCGWVDVLMLV